MPTIKSPSFGPKCPNHGSFLEGIGFPMPSKGVGMCPVSGAEFAFEVEVDEDTVVNDKFGVPQKRVGWRLSGKE